MAAHFGFGASAVTPMLFGSILDLAGGAGSEAAWLAAFAAQAIIGAAWPFAYLHNRLRSRRASANSRVNSIVAYRLRSA